MHHLSFEGRPLAMRTPADDMLVQQLLLEVVVFHQDILSHLQ